MKHFLFYILLVFVLASCKSTEESVRTYNIDLSQKANLKDYFDGYSFVRLETNKECLLANPRKMDIVDNIISVLDRDKIFFFDKSGKYLSKIDYVGKGHNEYIAIDDYCFQDTLVYILTRAQKAIYAYGIKGNLIKKITLKDWYAHIYSNGKDTLVLSSENANGSGKNFLVYDVKKDKVIAEYDNFKENENLLFESFRPFVGFCDGLLVAHPFDYRVYRLKKDGMEDFCEFQFKTKENSDFVKKGVPYEELMEKTTNRNIVQFVGPMSFVKNQMYLTFQLFDTVGGVGNHVCRIDTNGNSTNVRLFEKFDKRFPYITNPMGWHNDSLVSIVSASWILQMEKEYKLSKFNKMGVTKGDNNIIFFYKLKH